MRNAKTPTRQHANTSKRGNVAQSRRKLRGADLLIAGAQAAVRKALDLISKRQAPEVYAKQADALRQILAILGELLQPAPAAGALPPDPSPPGKGKTSSSLRRRAGTPGAGGD